MVKITTRIHDKKEDNSNRSVVSRYQNNTWRAGWVSLGVRRPLGSFVRQGNDFRAVYSLK